MKKILLLILIITLSGCAQRNAPTTDDSAILTNQSWEEHRQQIVSMDNWSLSGKLAIFLETERQTANIYWQQEGNNYNIQLTTFIGTRVLQVIKNEQGIEIINSDDEVFTGQDANELIQQLSPGLDLPITALQQWIKGNPDNAPFQLNETQQVGELIGIDDSQNVWEVKLQDYNIFSGIALPEKVDLTRDNMRVKIAINQWNIIAK
jgi:outer membrane lipoprotein LolB